MASDPTQSLIRAGDIRVSPHRVRVGPLGQTGGSEARVELEKQDGEVIAIRVVCSCGSELRLELDYQSDTG